MKIKDLDIECVSINYQTPNLIHDLIQSIRISNQNIPIRIIDGSSPDFINDFCYLDELKHQYDIQLERMEYNIHHGPGMDYAIRTTKHEWILFFDSDVILRQYPYDLEIEDGKYFIGRYGRVNKDGVDECKFLPSDYQKPIYLYPHPSFMLINVEVYKKFKSFIRHGAPCIKTWIDVNNNNPEYFQFFNVNDYIILRNRGTRNVWGINI
jgi:hypothetical protein